MFNIIKKESDSRYSYSLKLMVFLSFLFFISLVVSTLVSNSYTKEKDNNIYTSVIEALNNDIIILKKKNKTAQEALLTTDKFLYNSDKSILISSLIIHLPNKIDTNPKIREIILNKIKGDLYSKRCAIINKLSEVIVSDFPVFYSHLNLITVNVYNNSNKKKNLFYTFNSKEFLCKKSVSK